MADAANPPCLSSALLLLPCSAAAVCAAAAWLQQLLVMTAGCIQVNCKDRRGLLADLIATLKSIPVEVHTAHLHRCLLLPMRLLEAVCCTSCAGCCVKQSVLLVERSQSSLLVCGRSPPLLSLQPQMAMYMMYSRCLTHPSSSGQLTVPNLALQQSQHLATAAWHGTMRSHACCAQ